MLSKIDCNKGRHGRFLVGKTAIVAAKSPACCCRHHVIFHKIQANSCHGVLHLMAALMLDIRLMTDKSQAEVRLSDSETCVNKSVFNSPLHKY